MLACGRISSLVELGKSETVKIHAGHGVARAEVPLGDAEGLLL